MSRTIAVYGGSFDPPHIAHTLVCSYVLCAHAVDLVLVVPAGRHPFDKQLSAFEHRMKMCEIALRDLKRVELSSIERDLQGPSLTLRTLEHVQSANPDAALRLVIGSDLLPETPSWHRFDRICELAPPLVVPRAGFGLASADAPALPDLSSTEARRRLRTGLPTDGLLDPQVAAYAQSHGLYQGRPDALPGR